MKKFSQLLLLTAIIATCYSCKPPAPAPTPASFTITVEEDETNFKGLPALQSFVHGGGTGYWLLFGGRTNGFHGFGSQQNFPYQMANKYIYVYNLSTHATDTMHTDFLPTALRDQYRSTNMECRQIGKYLYVCGGYGVIHAGTKDSTWVTHNIISRIHVDSMIQAVLRKDYAAVERAIAWDTSFIVRSTGGELYQLTDDKFYLVLGHDFKGAYSNNNHIQKYLDSVHVFTLSETDSTIKIGSNFQYISDNLADSFTQFRRRDLVVSPNVQKGGTDYGISIYGGVFTVPGNTFHLPIYISSGNTPSYYLDPSFYQLSNLYSAPNLQMYDSANDQMYTTILGGLGDTLFVNGDSAAFTKQIMTVNRDNKQNKTSPIYNANAMPDYVGAEGLFIRVKDAPIYNNNSLGILDYNKISGGSNQLLGYIYGGIMSDSTQWSNVDTVINNLHYKPNITRASHKVYKVWINKK